ncbi:hypothetical protein BGZ88_001687 [Linnemannia elongata]|nr:hypothetical protein BGZ88_001687 [Linnemannia elongata]
MSASILRCTVCDPFRTFTSAEQERRHRLEYHAESFTVAIAAKSGLSETVVVNQVDGVFKCPICETSVITKAGRRKHLKNNLCTTGKDNNQDPPELTLPAVTLPKRQAIPPLPEPRQKPETRAFDDAILYSCGELHALPGEKRKTLGIVESLGLEPISIKDALGIEQNALAHATVIPRLPASSVELRPFTPQKRKLDNDETCPNCSPAPAPGLEHLLSSSPYAARLATRSYVELSDEICELLNRDWQFLPHLRYASAVILAGCLLINMVEPCIGASTPSLVLTDGSHSLATKIFLDTEHLETGLKMAESKDTWSISSSDLLYQLRQVKTKFFDVSTFYLCRASSFFADNHPCQPYTIFNLTSFDQAHSGDGVAASNLFHTIACDVIQDGSRAVLKTERVQQLRVRYADQGSISNEFDGILTLFGDDSSIPILGNPVLNKFLEKFGFAIVALHRQSHQDCCQTY